MQIGRRLKTIRLARGVTLAALSRDAGVSRSMLSKIERDESAPTVTTLEKVARALGVDLAALFVDAGLEGPAATAAEASSLALSSRAAPTPEERSAAAGAPAGADTTVIVVRGDRRKKVIMPWGADYEMLCPDMRHRIEFILITYPVNGGSGELYSHEGEECGVVVEGRFRGVVGDQEFVLEAGDSIYHSSRIPHRWENAGDVEAKAIWAITPPSFLLGKMSHE